MPNWEEKPTMISVSCCLLQGKDDEFHQWQADLNSNASINPGFISSEVTFSPAPPEAWVIVQRFKTTEDLKAWENSTEFKKKIADLEKYAIQGSVHYGTTAITGLQNGITEIFVTEVSPGKEAEFQKWNAKINEAESKFPGFRGAYLQSPASADSSHWITMIRFDTTENLDKWLASEERKEVLKESKALIASIEGHRMISPYAGWFSSVSKGGEAPPGWKQGMIVLLVLYPVVMLEFIFLAPLKNYLNLPVNTFVGNSLSVALTTYPLIPLAIYFLRWWLIPPKEKYREYTLKGVALLLGIYALQVLIFCLIF